MVLLIDGGDFIAGSKLQDSIKADYLAEGMSRLGYDAIGLGELDLLLGQKFLLNLAREKKLDIVSANVHYVDNDQLFVKPYVVRRLGGRKLFGLEAGGVRVAITSVLRLDDGAKIEAKRDDDRELIVKDPIIAARRVVQELRGKADVIILMAHTGMDPAKEIAHGVGGVDLMPVGHGNFRNKEAVFIGKTPLMQPGDQGRMVAVMEAKLTNQKRFAGATARLVSLDASYPDDEPMAALVKDYRGAVRAANILPEWPDMDKEMYLGTETCVGCHPQEDEQWKTTRHAHAWETMVKEGVDRDLECVPCHVTGFGSWNGFRRADVTPDRMNVQCEVCHGPGKDHYELITGGGDRTRLPLHGLLPITPKTCTQCHRDHHDPEFDYNKKIFLVAHKPEEFRKKFEEMLKNMPARQASSHGGNAHGTH
jgi:2',3'-cyclic-nucleotide 2'-phosphodiesterase (5'-nucleotidase family)